MTEFYGPEKTAEATSPEDDPLLTVRIQPPNTQARRLDLGTPRAVRVSESGIACWATVNWPSYSTFVGHDEIRDWEVEHPITYSAAARLAHAIAPQVGSIADLWCDCVMPLHNRGERDSCPPSPAKVMESDEDASPFR
jgi:hypothetical protein